MCGGSPQIVHRLSSVSCCELGLQGYNSSHRSHIDFWPAILYDKSGLMESYRQRHMEYLTWHKESGAGRRLLIHCSC